MIPAREELPEDAGDWSSIEVTLPHLPNDSPSSCPCSLEEIVDYIRKESADLEEADQSCHSDHISTIDNSQGARRRGNEGAMSRPLRIERAGGWYHITAQANDRQAIFGDDRDRTHFCELLSEMVSI